jgi:Clp amino terminal domain, pathogenicity island component
VLLGVISVSDSVAARVRAELGVTRETVDAVVDAGS